MAKIFCVANQKGGVGKTTTIGKLAYQFKKQGYKVVLGAADTFRAAAIDQLHVLGEQIGVDVFSNKEEKNPIKTKLIISVFIFNWVNVWVLYLIWNQFA